MATRIGEEGERETPPPEQRGRLLRPSTVAVLKQALQHYLEHERDFVDAYFPEVARRGYVTWGDVFGLSDRQADACRPILLESIRHFLKEDARERNRNVHLLTREPVDPNFVSFPARKAKAWTEALRDLCNVFGLECLG
ncbi:MAG: hypothetical protein WA691_05945 [Thermoplasmata archaeon]